MLVCEIFCLKFWAYSTVVTNDQRPTTSCLREFGRKIEFIALWSLPVQEQLMVNLVLGIYQGFYSSAEGYPYKIQSLLAGTLLIPPSITVSRSFGWVDWKRLHRLSWAEPLAHPSQDWWQRDSNQRPSASEDWDGVCWNCTWQPLIVQLQRRHRSIILDFICDQRSLC